MRGFALSGLALAGLVVAGVPAAVGGVQPAAAIAFESTRVTGTTDIFVTTPSGEPQVRLTRGPGNESTPSWSPDRRQIAFANDRNGLYSIWLMNADGSGQRQLTTSHGNDVNPTWAPDGTRLAFSGGDGKQWDVFLRPLQGVRTRLTRTAANEVNVSWSPAGDTVVYDRLERGTSDLWTHAVNASAGKPLTRTPGVAELNPAWSPLGDAIAYDAHDAKGNYDLYVLDVETKRSRRLTSDAADDSDPVWSPDGTRLVFTRATGPDLDLFVINPDGSGLRNLTRGPRGLDFSPAWGGDVPAGRLLQAAAAAAAPPPPVFACQVAYTGNDNPNTITGNDSGNRICGKGAADKVNGGKGVDYISGGNGGDTFHGNDHGDFLKARPETPETGTTLPKDWVYGDGGTDTAWVGAEDYVSANTVYKL